MNLRGFLLYLDNISLLFIFGGWDVLLRMLNDENVEDVILELFL